MFNNQKIVVTMTSWTKRIGNCVKVIQSILENTVKPDIVFLNLSLEEFPNRLKDLPKDLVELSLKNPKVKIGFDSDIQTIFTCATVIDVNESTQVHEKFIEDRFSQLEPKQNLDMTAISVFYDAGINELRKVATRKAVSHWMEQKNLPKEMMFIELGFNGVFTFSQDDFPKEINYIRIDGEDKHKFLWQKENLWNIGAKRAKYDKLMFIDSDVSPLNDQNWFYEVSLTLNECLFTQGFRRIVYLKNDESPSRTKKLSFTTTWLENGYIHPRDGVPAGVCCISKQFLEMIGYFNAFSCGYSDILLWEELIGESYDKLLGTLFKREYVKTIIKEIENYTQKKLMKQVYVDIVHFYHGEFSNRSYTQRNYMWLSQYPWNNRIVALDDIGLMMWIDTSHYFYNVMSQFHTINDDAKKANDLMKQNINYVDFVRQIQYYLDTYKRISPTTLIKIINGNMKRG